MVEDVDLMILQRYNEFEAEHGLGLTFERKSQLRNDVRAVSVELAVVGGERIRLGPDWEVELLHTPGHSPGHLSVYDLRSRCAIISDAVLGSAIPRCDGTPAFAPTYRYLDPYLSTIERLRAMPIALLLTGHFPIYRGDAVAGFLEESRAFVDRVDMVLQSELMASRSPCTLRELTTTLSPRLGSWPADSSTYLAQPLVAHLERLVQQGQVAVWRKEGLLAWRWSDAHPSRTRGCDVAL
jgi:glyoxylase-like metal-dependent hydrolase (beta-lactamase superfamily II)